jgi:hypothetical protein
MALYKYICPKCLSKRRVLADIRPEEPKCKVDGEPMITDIGGSTSVLDRLDNGVMTRVLERPRDYLELRHSHNELVTKEDEHII